MDRRNECDESSGEESEVDDLRQLELDRNHNDQKLKSRFEHIFRKYEHDFEGIGDEIEIDSGDIVVDNGHLQHMRHEADPGKSASSRFVKTFQEKLGYEDESSSEEDEEDEDDDGTEDDENEESVSDERSETPAYRDTRAHASSHQRQRRLSPRKAMRAFGDLARPAPRLAHLLVGEGTPQPAMATNLENQDDSSIESISGTSTPTNVLNKVPGLQESIRALQPRAKRSDVGPEAIEALGMSIANQLAQLMAGPSKSKRKEARAKERKAAKKSVWDYPELAPRPRKKRRRSPSPIALPLPSSPAPGSPGEESLWAPEDSVRPSKRSRRAREGPQATPAVTRSKRLQLPSSGAGTSRKEVRRCWNCSLTSTPSWQEGPHGQDLCESCARYYLHNRRMKPFDSPTPSAEDDEQYEETREDRDARNTQEHSRSRRQATPPVEAVSMPNTTRVQTDGNADEHDNVGGTQILEPAGSYFYRPIPTNVPDPHSNLRHHSGPSTTQSRMATDDSHRQQHQPENTLSRYPQRISDSPIASETSDRDSGQDESEEEPPRDDSRSRQSDRHMRNSRTTLHEHYEGTRDHEWAQDRVIDVDREQTGHFRAAPQHKAQSPDRAVNSAAGSSQTGVQSETGYLANTSRILITSPSRRKGYFSIEEDILIIRLKEQEKLTWDEITPYFPHRSPYAISGRYTRELKFGRNPARDWLEAQAEANSNNVDEGPDPLLREDLAWNENQDELLLELREDQELEWHEIASLLPGHSPEAVEERYELLAQRGMEQHQQKYNLPTLKSEDYAEAEEKVANWMLYFSPEEDALIVRLREVEGLQWSEIGKQLRSRPLASIQRRYSRSLAPQVRKVTPTSKHDFVKGSMEDRLLAVDPRLSGVGGAALYSPEEDHLIKTMKEDYGLSWEVIAQRLPGRTADAARHRYEYRYGAEAEAARQEAERLATIAARQSKSSQPAPYPGMGVIEFNAPPPLPSPAASPPIPIRSSGHKLVRPRSTAPRIPPLHPPPQQSFNNMPVVSEPLDTTAALPRSPQKKSKAGPGSRTPFTEDEDDALLQLREMRGLSWEDIAMTLPGRSVNSISSRYANTIRPARAVTSRVVLDPTTNTNPSHLPARPVQQTAAASTPIQPRPQPASSQGPQHMSPVSASSSRQQQDKTKSRPPRKGLPSRLPSASRSQNPLLRKALDNSLRRRSDMGSAAMSFDQNGNPPKTTSSREPEAPSQQLLREMASSLQTPVPNNRPRTTAASPAAQDESSSESSEVGYDQMYQNLMHAATKFAIQQKNPALFSRVKEIFGKNPADDRLHQLLELASTSSATTLDVLSAFEHIVDPSPVGRGEKRILQSRATQSRPREAAPASQQPPATSQRLPVRTPTRRQTSKLNGSGFTSAATSVAGRHKTATAPQLEEANTVHHGEQRQDTGSQQPHSTGRPRRAAFNDASRRNAELLALPVEDNGETGATRVVPSNAPSRSRSRAVDTNMFTDHEPSASAKNDQGGLVFVPEGKRVRGRPRRSDLDWSPYESILKAFKTNHRDFMPLKEIYAAVEADYVPDGNWKLAVRTAVNKKPCFERAVDDEGRSGWRLMHEGDETQDGNRGGASGSFSQESASASRYSRRNVTFNSNGDDPYVPEDNESTFVTDADETIVVNVAPKQRRIVSNINARNAKNSSTDDGMNDDLSAPANSFGQLSSPGQHTPRQGTATKSILKNSGTSRKETPRVIEIANSDDEDELSPGASLHEVDELDLPTSPPSRRGSLNVLPTSDINRDPLSSDAAAPVVKSSSSKRTRDPKGAAVPSSSPLFMKPRTPASALPKKLVTPRPSTSRLSQLMKETPVRAQSPIFMSRSASVASAKRSSLGKRIVETPVREVDSDEDELA